MFKYTPLPQHQLWKDFFQLFKSSPALWNANNSDYKNRRKKMMCNEALLHIYNKIDPSADLRDMKNKLNNLRTCFRREYKKVIESMGDGGEPDYEPTLWYYKYLTFLEEDADFSRVENKSDECDESVVSYSDLKPEPVLLENTEYDSQLEFDLQPQKKRKSAPSDIKEEDCSDNQIDEYKIHEPPLKEIRRSLNHSRGRRNFEDEAHIFGKAWACGFRKMSEEQKLYAKRAIDEILVLGQMNRLTFDAMTLVQRTSRPSTCSSTSKRRGRCNMPSSTNSLKKFKEKNEEINEIRGYETLIEDDEIPEDFYDYE